MMFFHLNDKVVGKDVEGSICLEGMKETIKLSDGKTVSWAKFDLHFVSPEIYKELLMIQTAQI
jgi:hypothetical protein